MNVIRIWRTACCAIIIISIIGFGSLVMAPPAFTHQPVETLVVNETIYGSTQLQAEISVFQWSENDQPWDRYRISMTVNPFPNRWFKCVCFHVEFTQDGEVYEWGPIEGCWIFGVIDAVGEYGNDFWINKVWWPSLQDAMECRIEIPNDAGLNVRVSVMISYFNCLKEPIEYEDATTGWLNIPDLWPE